MVTGDVIHVLQQDAGMNSLLICIVPNNESLLYFLGISCMAACKLKGKENDIVLFGDREGKLSYLDLETLQVIHLLPNILIGTGKYCRYVLMVD